MDAESRCGQGVLWIISEIATNGIHGEIQTFQTLRARRSYESVDKGRNSPDSLATSDFDSGPSMRSATRLSSAERNRIYRERLRAAGGEEVLFKLPSELVILLDDLKERRGLRNRSQALLQLIEEKGATAQ